MTAVLRVLHDAMQRREFLTEAEIYDRAIKMKPRWYDEEFFIRTREYPMSYLLFDLRDLGMIEHAGPEEGFPSDGTLHWRLRPEWMTVNGDGGRDAPPPPRVDDGDERPGDGSLREVLGHRYLFALSDSDFDIALDNALGIER